MKRNRFLAFVLVVAMMLSVCLVGCTTGDETNSTGSAGNASSQSSGGESQEIELEFWTINLKKSFNDYIQGMIDAYESEHPNIKINWVDVPGADVTKKMVTALASDDVPDVINETMLGFATVKSQGVLAPFNEYVSEEALGTFIPGLCSPLMQNGNMYAIPWYNMGSYVSFINAELYNKAGLDPNKAPTNVDELLENGRIIYEKTGVYGSNDFPTLLIMQAEGLPIVSEDGKTAVFNSSEHVALIQKFVDAYQNGALAPGCIGKDDRSYQQSFASGQIAQMGWWIANKVKEVESNAPEMLKNVVLAPAIRGKAGTVPLKDANLLMVPAKSQHPKEAAEFAMFVASPENQLEFCKLAAIYPSTLETMQDDIFTNVTGDTLMDEARRIQVATSADISVDAVAAMDNAIQLNELYNEQVRAALTGQITVQQALDTAVEQWNQLLSK